MALADHGCADQVEPGRRRRLPHRPACGSGDLVVGHLGGQDRGREARGVGLRAVLVGRARGLAERSPEYSRTRLPSTASRRRSWVDAIEGGPPPVVNAIDEFGAVVVGVVAVCPAATAVPPVLRPLPIASGGGAGDEDERRRPRRAAATGGDGAGSGTSRSTSVVAGIRPTSRGSPSASIGGRGSSGVSIPLQRRRPRTRTAQENPSNFPNAEGCESASPVKRAGRRVGAVVVAAGLAASGLAVASTTGGPAAGCPWMDAGKPVESRARASACTP